MTDQEEEALLKKIQEAIDTRPCSFCQAKPGEPCTSPTGIKECNRAYTARTDCHSGRIGMP